MRRLSFDAAAAIGIICAILSAFVFGALTLMVYAMVIGGSVHPC